LSSARFDQIKGFAKNQASYVVRVQERVRETQIDWAGFIQAVKLLLIQFEAQAPQIIPELFFAARFGFPDLA